MSIPKQSSLYDYAKGAYFSDSYSEIMDYDGQTALELFIAMMLKTPRWMNVAMTTRNVIVSALGLKNLGDFTSIHKTEFEIGERIGIFTLVSQTNNEIVVEDKDKHLNVRISFLIEPQSDNKKATIHVTTVVFVHNALGRMYMLFVKPFHKIIAPKMLKKLL